ncbi:MAG: glycosyltransferase family 2 protein [Actinomycetales bacterium]|nr:glycosyltransferase family 2 protein [Actinomycetales bacterium]
MPSVVIPAHNEENLIDKTLRGVVTDGLEGLEVVVVVNGSSDATAERAREFGHGIKVIETSTPGKCNALNLGEAELTRFPRVFLDADIELRPGTLRAIVEAAGLEDVHIVAPTPRFDLTGASLAVRLYKRAERFNPYFGSGAPNGSGCFVLTERGRGRWAKFPDIVADDGFVQGHFKTEERESVPGTTAIVQQPRDLKSLLAVMTRARRGGFELQTKFPDLMQNHQSHVGGMVKRLLVRPWEWPAMFMYGYVRIVERLIAKRQIARGETGWGRDETGRSL